MHILIQWMSVAPERKELHGSGTEFFITGREVSDFFEPRKATNSAKQASFTLRLATRSGSVGYYSVCQAGEGQALKPDGTVA